MGVANNKYIFHMNFIFFQEFFSFKNGRFDFFCYAHGVNANWEMKWKNTKGENCNEILFLVGCVLPRSSSLIL